ncbi:MAG: RES family NAD+ phosphorylase [Gemmatimonadetes bacterium]|nr:RES family NAD+ phosphorylase [Gemmatimonadota bacterium]
MTIRLPGRLPVVTVPASKPLWRVHLSTRPVMWYGPGTDSPSSGRFDDPALGFGVCYLGETPGVAVLETLVRGADYCVVAQAQWGARSIAQVRLAEPLHMVQFEGPKLPAFGVGMDRAGADDPEECQELAAAVHAASTVDGIQYRSRFDPSKLCWALFGRASGKVAGVSFTQRLASGAIGLEVLDEYSIVLV